MSPRLKKKGKKLFNIGEGKAASVVVAHSTYLPLGGGGLREERGGL